jgi:hypothetical protein
MKWWRELTPVLRRIMALAMLAAFTDAAALRADEGDCEAVDNDGLPRECTFSERLGKCAWEVKESWEQCLDTDHDGVRDANSSRKGLCDFWAAADLLVCGLMIPIDYVFDVD